MAFRAGDYGTKNHSHNRKWQLRLVAVAVIVGLFGVLVWQYLKARAELKRYNDPKAAVQEAAEGVETDIKKIVLLPEGDTQTVWDISDTSKLPDEPFFKNAKNGDKVLVYKQKDGASKAIIYRPSSKQIVEILVDYSSEGETEPAEPAE